LRPLAFQKLTPETEKLYMASFNSTIDRYRELLAEQDAGDLKLPNPHVGRIVQAGIPRNSGLSAWRLRP